MSKQIVVDVSPDGRVKLQNKGYEGMSCKAASRAIEQAMGIVLSDTPCRDVAQAVSVSHGNALQSLGARGL